MDAQQPPTVRLQLIAPLGRDAMGTHWRAVDRARGREVRDDELTGADAQRSPALPAGHELVVDGRRTYVVGPAVVEPQPRPPRTGLVLGIVAAGVLALVLLVGGVVVLLSGLAAS